jgi:hypothetical protein
MPMYQLAIVGSVLLFMALTALRFRRVWLYRTLDRRLAEIKAEAASVEPVAWRDRPLPSFDDRLAVLPNLLAPEQLARIALEIERLSSSERSYVPAHKKGGTIAYETLCAEAPAVVALYSSPRLHALLSRIVGVEVRPTPLNDQSSCSVLLYERPGDHIGWHYDHNFYKGRHFTVLLPIVNRNAAGDGLSAARLSARIGSEDREIPTPPNKLVVFEGARVLHKASPIAEGERRVVLSMTFATDPSSTIVQGVTRRIKDTAFFGLRALWT